MSHVELDVKRGMSRRTRIGQKLYGVQSSESSNVSGGRNGSGPAHQALLLTRQLYGFQRPNLLSANEPIGGQVATPARRQEAMPISTAVLDPVVIEHFDHPSVRVAGVGGTSWAARSSQARADVTVAIYQRLDQ